MSHYLQDEIEELREDKLREEARQDSGPEEDIEMKIVHLIEAMGWQRLADEVRDGAVAPERALDWLHKNKLAYHWHRTLARAAWLVYTGNGSIDIDTLTKSLEDPMFSSGNCSNKEAFPPAA